jgi:hypothetical protein
MLGPSENYINDVGFEVPENKIIIIPNSGTSENMTGYAEVIKSLKGQIKRDWFNTHFYHCLPLNIGNQYGFTIHSMYDFDVTWDGRDGATTEGSLDLKFKDTDKSDVQEIQNMFDHGILTITHSFYLKTPPGVNLMTIQAPNMFTPGISVMTGVVESDQLRRTFTFNLKITDPNREISFKKGDVLAAFIPIPRYFVDKFDIAPASKYFSPELIANEHKHQAEFNRQRREEEELDTLGRKYFNGVHAFGEPYSDHQKRLY